MIKDDFIIDFEKIKIRYNPKGSNKTYQIKEFYSYIQNVFDEPENMKYDIPIVAKSNTRFSLVNGWSIDNNAKKHLKEGKLEIDLKV